MTTLLWSPVGFFTMRLRRGPDWLTALAAPVLCAALQAVSVAIVHRKTAPLRDAISAQIDGPLITIPPGLPAAMSVLSYPLLFCLLTLAVLAMDVLIADSGRATRLTEFTALGFYTQVPYCLVMIAIAALWVPEPIHLTEGASLATLLTQVQRYRARLAVEPLLSTGRLLACYSIAWLAVVLGAAVKVNGRLSTRASAAVALALFALGAAEPILGALAGALR